MTYHTCIDISRNGTKATTERGYHKRGVVTVIMDSESSNLTNLKQGLAHNLWMTESKS